MKLKVFNCLVVALLVTFLSCNSNAQNLDDIKDLVEKKLDTKDNYKTKLSFDQSSYNKFQEIEDIEFLDFTKKNFDSLLINVSIGDKRYNIAAKIYRYLNVPVAKNDIVNGQLITDEYIDMEDVLLNKISKDIIVKNDKIIGMMSRRLIKKGNTFKNTDLKKDIVIARGEIVNLKFSRNNLEITTVAKTLSEGSAGDLIKLKVLESGKVIMGTIIDSSSVEMKNNEF
ncbi:MAG: flagella basal body P-ring formation protein FlgA [Candidatus Midichloriaceae bacterium]